MRELFSLDGPVLSFMNKVADILLVNLLWFICCIPIVTAGASTTALYYVTLKIVKNEESYIIKSFFRSFKENFKQATIIWLIAVVLGVFLGVDLYLCRIGGMPGSKVLLYIIGVIYILFFMTLSYVFPVLARFQTTTKNIVRNSFLMSVGHLPYTIFILILSYGPLYLMYRSVNFLLIGVSLYIFFAGGLFAVANSFFFVKIFKKYMPEEEPIEESQWPD